MKIEQGNNYIYFKLEEFDIPFIEEIGQEIAHNLWEQRDVFI